MQKQYPLKKTGILSQGQILDKERLKQGGTLLILPFSASRNVVSNNRSDEVSIWIMRGIYDVLGKGNPDKIFDVYDLDDKFFDGDGDVVIVDEDNNVIKVGKQDRFELFFSEDIDYIDLILRGHITLIKRDFFLKRWMFRKDKLQLAVDGELVEKSTNNIVLHFEDSKIKTGKRTDLNKLAREVGQDIGRFLLSGIE